VELVKVMVQNQAIPLTGALIVEEMAG